MQYSFRIYNVKENREFLFGVNNTNNNELLEIINKVIKNRNCVTDLVPFDDKTLLGFKTYNAMKYFLFGLCNFSLEDVHELDNLGFRVQKLNLSIYSSGLFNMYISYYKDEVEECEELKFSDLFVSDKDTTYKGVKNSLVSAENEKYYKSKYGKYYKLFAV